MNSNYALIAMFALILTNLPIKVHAQPPCPPDPSLATIVDTPEKCSCFYALVSSGLDVADASTFDLAFDDDSVQNFLVWVKLSEVLKRMIYSTGNQIQNHQALAE